MGVLPVQVFTGLSVILYLIYSYYHRKRARNTPNRKEGDLHFVFFCFSRGFVLGGGEKQDACYGYERELSTQPLKTERYCMHFRW